MTEQTQPSSGFVTQHGFPTTYGRGNATGVGDRPGVVVAVSDPDVWRWYAPEFGPAPAVLIDAVELGPERLDELAASVPAEATIIGIGGGVAMDVAKWIHWRRGLSLIQVPTLPSVNACFTRMTALRDGGRVRYEGDAVPDEVIVDYRIFAGAPAAMVRAGIGDVLSCHTALWDWRVAVMAGHDPAWDDDSAGASMRYLDGLRQAAAGIHDVTDTGIRSLMEMHREIGWRCHVMRHARFEEGSEHFFAYCFEEVTGRTILHGELVSLGVLVMSTIQGNNPWLPRAIVHEAGTRHRPEDLGISWDEIDATLDRLQEFTVDGGYWHSVIQQGFDVGWAKEQARAALDFD